MHVVRFPFHLTPVSSFYSPITPVYTIIPLWIPCSRVTITRSADDKYARDLPGSRISEEYYIIMSILAGSTYYLGSQYERNLSPVTLTAEYYTSYKNRFNRVRLNPSRIGYTPQYFRRLQV